MPASDAIQFWQNDRNLLLSPLFRISDLFTKSIIQPLCTVYVLSIEILRIGLAIRHGGEDEPGSGSALSLFFPVCTVIVSMLFGFHIDETVL